MLSAMKEIINPDVLIHPDFVNKELLLKEDSTESKIKKLYITKIPDNAIAFTLDHQPGGRDNRWFKQLSPYIDASNDKGVNKRCDLILLWQEDDQYYALIFDLKSDRPKAEATQKQLDNSALYLKYLLSMITLHYGIETNHVQILKAIGTTDSRAARKSATYRPNNITDKTSRHHGYHIEVITPKPHQTGYIALSRLARARVTDV